MAAGVLSGGVAGGKLRKPVSSLYMPIQQSGGCLFKPVAQAHHICYGRTILKNKILIKNLKNKILTDILICDSLDIVFFIVV